MIKHILIFLLLICSHSLVAGSDSTNFFYGMKYRQMLIVPHTSDLKPFAGTMPLALQFEFGKLSTKQSSWEQCNCFSMTGFSVGMTNFANKKQLGQSFDFTLFTEVFLSTKSQRQHSVRAGSGVSYLTRPFEDSENPQNYFYSSHIGFNLQLGYQISFTLNDFWTVNAALMMNHISNGGMKKPNRGMNFPGVDISFRYSTKKLTLPDFNKNESIDKRLKYWIQPFTFVQTGAWDYGFDIENKPGIGLNLAALKPLSRLSQLGIGVEMVYDGLFKEYDQKIEFVRFDPFSCAVNIQHNLVFKKAVFTNLVGYYIYRQHPFQNHQFYQRYSLHFKMSERIYPGISLKTHGSAAEYLAISIATLFN